MKLDGWPRVGLFDCPDSGRLIGDQTTCIDIRRTADSRVYAIEYESGTYLFHFPSPYGPNAWYSVVDPVIPARPKAVLMDLDGTTALTERIWNDLIQDVARELLEKPNFLLSKEDIPHVSGFSVEENIRYVLTKYGTRHQYEEKVARGLDMQAGMMKSLLDRLSRGEDSATRLIEPAPCLKDMLCWLREQGVKIALVSSAPEVKVLAEIRCVFDKLGMGDPVMFYDAIVTTGISAKAGQVGTMGEVCSKPHPWLYSEALRQLEVAAGDAIGIEDSSAGILALTAAGIPSIGVGFSSPMLGTPQTLCCRCFVDLSGVASWLMR